MKRPLFWAVAMFALGEVIGIYFNSLIHISMLTGMLIFGVKTAKKNKNRKMHAIDICVLMASLTFGNINSIRIDDRPDIVDVIIDNSIITDNNSDTKLCNDIYTVESVKRYNLSELNVYGEGRVIDVEENNSGSNNVIVKVEKTLYLNRQSKENYKIYLYNVGNYRLGQRVSFSGSFKAFEEPSNIGVFNSRRYYEARGIYGSINSPKLNLIDSSYNYYLEGLRYIRKKCCEKLHSITDSKDASILCSIIFGEDSLDETYKKMLQYNGIAHILAISGLHIGILGGYLYKLIRRVTGHFILAGIATILLIVSYGIMTGNGIATVRAIIMLSISVLGDVLGKFYDLLTGMAVAFAAMLLYNPSVILDGGFLLSYTAIFGVTLGKYICNHIYHIIKGKYKKKMLRLIYGIISGIVMALSINLVMLPVISALYYEVPTYSVLLNLIVIPLMTVLFISGLGAIIISYLGIGIGMFIIKPAEFILWLYEKLCELVMKLPCHTINTGRVSVVTVLIYYGVIILVLIITSERCNPRIIGILKHRVRLIKNIHIAVCKAAACAIIIIPGIISIFIIQFKVRENNIIFIDVGQGDGTIITTSSGVDMVIDAGSTSNKSFGEYTLVPVLKAMRMADIDYYFISHTDYDHISGIVYILENYELSGIRIRNLVIAKYAYKEDKLDSLIESAEKRGVNIIYMNSGDIITDGSFSMSCIFPDDAYISEDTNASSQVLEYIDGELSVLFTGDIGNEQLEYLVEHKSIHSYYDILKVPHHGSKYSCNERFYESIHFNVAVISCGRYNRYGHPGDELIDALESANIDIYRTDYDGAVIVNNN